MSFEIPDYLSKYLNNESRKPSENFVNNSQYYSNIDTHFINYMSRVVRPCIAYSTAVVDGQHSSLLSTATGKTLVDAATRIVKSERPFFEGDNTSCDFLSDVWAPYANFNTHLERSTRFMLAGGTCPIKIDKDEFGRTSLSAYRVDRAIINTSCNGDVNEAVFFISLLSSVKSQNGVDNQYWLVEHRKYNETMQPIIKYKVFRKSGIAEATTLPDPYVDGCAYKPLPQVVKYELSRMGIRNLNTEKVMPFYDGLGVWQVLCTATNACLPDVFMGDPLLYGVLDLLWSLDVVFSGTIIDVLNGKGKVLVPKQFLQQIAQSMPNLKIDTKELNKYDDDSFVYLMPQGGLNEKTTPTAVQFDIRGDMYKTLWELYEREIAVRAGFAPTSIFPHLQDFGAKTATEVNAEDNMTRATVMSMHSRITDVYNRALKEVLRQEGLSTDVQLHLSDYIGNKVQADKNLRENYAAGLIPEDIAIQKANNISKKETDEYVKKIRAESQRRAQEQMSAAFGEPYSDEA